MQTRTQTIYLRKHTNSRSLPQIRTRHNTHYADLGLCRCRRRNFCAREDSDRRCRHNRGRQARRGCRPGVVSARWAGQWSHPVEGSFVEVEVGELWRGLDVLVAEPERDNAGVDADFQEPPGGVVSQYVAATFFGRYLGTDRRRCQRRVMRRSMASRVSGLQVRVGNGAVSEAPSRSRRQSCRVFGCCVGGQSSVRHQDPNYADISRVNRFMSPNPMAASACPEPVLWVGERRNERGPFHRRPEDQLPGATYAELRVAGGQRSWFHKWLHRRPRRGSAVG